MLPIDLCNVGGDSYAIHSDQLTSYFLVDDRCESNALESIQEDLIEPTNHP